MLTHELVGDTSQNDQLLRFLNLLELLVSSHRKTMQPEDHHSAAAGNKDDEAATDSGYASMIAANYVGNEPAAGANTGNASNRPELPAQGPAQKCPEDACTVYSFASSVVPDAKRQSISHMRDDIHAKTSRRYGSHRSEGAR